ncbi:MAG: flotillin family protein [Lactobacillales bacterium]|nr:flotillin family protein [Lactobacillales bacterium]
MLTNSIFSDVILVVIVLAILLIFIKSCYRTALPDEALIVSGSLLGNNNVNTDQFGNKVKIVRGGGTFVLPIVQQAKKLSLLSSKLEVATEEVYTKAGVPVIVNGTVMVKVGSSIEEIATAAEQYLGKPREDLEIESREVLEGHLRAIIGSMTVEDLYQNRDEFSEKVQEMAASDLMKMGLTIVSFTVKEIRDTNGYLDSLGRPQIAKVRRDADIAEAEAAKETRIKRADAEQLAQRAELERQTEIAESTKDKELKLATYKKEQDIAKAEADQAYDIQSAKAKQTTTAEQMQVQVIERTKQIELEEKEILRREREYDADVRKKADAERYAVEQQAAALKAQAIAKAEAEAERIRIEGDAEAEKVRKIGLAEAEALEKKAEAMAKYTEAGKLSLVLDVLPQIVSASAENLGKVDSINLYGGDGANKILGIPETTLKRGLDVLGTMGIDIPGLVNSISSKNEDIPLEEVIKEIEEEITEE